MKSTKIKRLSDIAIYGGSVAGLSMLGYKFNIGEKAYRNRTIKISHKMSYSVFFPGSFNHMDTEFLPKINLKYNLSYPCPISESFRHTIPLHQRATRRMPL